MKSKEIVSAVQRMDGSVKSPMVPAAWDKLDDELINDDNGFVRPKTKKKKRKQKRAK